MTGLGVSQQNTNLSQDFLITQRSKLPSQDDLLVSFTCDQKQKFLVPL